MISRLRRCPRRCSSPASWTAAGGEVTGEVVLQDRIVGQLALHDLRVRPQLAVREEHAQLRARKGATGLLTLGQCLEGRQCLLRSVEQPCLLQRRDQVAEVVARVDRPQLVQRHGPALGPIVQEHERRHCGGQLLQKLVAPLLGDPSRAHRRIEQDLEVDLVVGQVHAARVVERVGVDAAATEGVLDARPLREAEITPLSHHLTAQLVGVHPAPRRWWGRRRPCGFLPTTSRTCRCHRSRAARPEPGARRG